MYEIRNIVLQDIRKDKTILMPTNSMEAADFVADRIAIIANGRIECYGSKMYLNRRYSKIYLLLSLSLSLSTRQCGLDSPSRVNFLSINVYIYI